MKWILKILFVMNAVGLIINAQSIRPIRDDVGFCWNASEMNSFIKFLEKNPYDADESSQNLIGGISVHDDYLYAGKIYYPLYKIIKTKEVVIFGVTHGTVRKEMGTIKDVLIMDNFDQWQGPYGQIEISPLREEIKSELPKPYFIVSDKAQSIEHSIEALIPFLQYYNHNIKITPIMVTGMNFERMDSISSKLSVIIAAYSKANKLEPGKDIFFLISNDADHYGEDFNNSHYGLDLAAHAKATENDKRILRNSFELTFDKSKIEGITKELWPDSSNQKIVPLWCGRYPIVMGLLTIEKVIGNLSGEKVHGKLFRYSDSLTEKVLKIDMGLTAVFSPKHWCGWFTLGLYKSN